ncbi:hypothetical protein K3495_g2505 [Podosphaera aphanis]|nr:hypothetical protein K3495_g2505 [Podosphaera aphanis]
MLYGAIAGGISFNPDTDIQDLGGKIIFITGGNRGIGLETALALAKHNPAHIYISARSQASADTAISTIQTAAPATKVTFLPCDLTDLPTVVACAREFLSREERLDTLILNAGIMATPPGLTKQGYELQFGTNHVGHFLLTRLLLPTLQRTAKLPNADVRIVAVSSIAHTWAPSGGIVFAELKSNMKGWLSMRRYGQSKLANILLIRELSRQATQDNSGILAVAIHPGVVNTGLYEHTQKWPGGTVLLKLLKLFPSVFLDPPIGAKTQIWAATAERAPVGMAATDKKALGKVVSGEYYTPFALAGQGTAEAHNDELARKLWEWSEEEVKSYLI